MSETCSQYSVLRTGNSRLDEELVDLKGALGRNHVKVGHWVDTFGFYPKRSGRAERDFDGPLAVS